ncbi:hypothetical protein WJ42_12750 [Burkholderia cepacia]|nr:hypothetical protein WJ42_12750 [Burkholderia cepacia]KWC73205.1 hypothetical protein WL55_05280 [Burkholderia cepacia]
MRASGPVPAPSRRPSHRLDRRRANGTCASRCSRRSAACASNTTHGLSRRGPDAGSWPLRPHAHASRHGPRGRRRAHRDVT